MSAAFKVDVQHPFMDREVVLNIANGVVETLKILADITADFEKPFVADHWQSPTEVSVYLNLNSEPFCGKIHFHFDVKVAKYIIETLTGSSVPSDSDEILDGVGEISNIFYGSAKTKLNGIGYNLKMSLPTPCWTKDLPPSPDSKKCMIIPFKVNNALCYVEIVIV